MAGENPNPNEASPVGSVILAWKTNADLVLSSAGGIMCKVGKAKDLDRKEVCQNQHIIGPVIEYLGPWDSKLLTPWFVFLILLYIA